MIKIKKRWIVLSVFVLLVMGGCFGDRAVSELIFKYHCDKSAGQFIYEKVKLEDKYFTEQSKTGREFNYLYRGGLFVEKNIFDKDYKYITNKSTVISDYGPVKSIEFLVYRLSDNKLLGKLVTISTGLGWVNNFWSFGYAGKGCPVGVNEKGERIRSQMRREFLSKIFSTN